MLYVRSGYLGEGMRHAPCNGEFGKETAKSTKAGRMKILALSDVHGGMERLQRVRDALSPAPEVIVFTGDIVRGKARGDEWLEAKARGRDANRDKETIKREEQEDLSLYHGFFEILRDWGIPTFFVPGNMDAPKRRYFEAVLRSCSGGGNMKCVHGVPAFSHGFLVSGVGGEITEDDDEDFFVLQVPRWEVEHCVSFLPDFRERKILLFHTPPVGTLDLDKGNHKGSRVVNEIMERYKPWLAFCGHAHNSRGKEKMSETVAINPGSLKAGNYALVDSETREVEFRNVTG